MRYRFIDEHRAIWPLVAMAKALAVSRQGYHAWKRRLPAQRTVRMRERTRQIQRVYDESNGSYGSPRVTLVLRKAGDVVSEKRCRHYAPPGPASHSKAALPAVYGLFQDTCTGS